MAFFSKITNIFKKKKKDEYWFVPENSNSNFSRHASQNTSKYEPYTEAEAEKPLKAKKAAKESKKEKRAANPIQKEAQPQKVDKNTSSLNVVIDVGIAFLFSPTVFFWKTLISIVSISPVSNPVINVFDETDIVVIFDLSIFDLFCSIPLPSFKTLRNLSLADP